MSFHFMTRFVEGSIHENLHTIRFFEGSTHENLYRQEIQTYLPGFFKTRLYDKGKNTY